MHPSGADPSGEVGMVDVAARCLSDALGVPISVGDGVAETLRHESIVLRCPVESMGCCVVVKAFRPWAPLPGEESEQRWRRRFNPDRGFFPTASDRFRQEVAALRFMAEPFIPVRAPQLYASDPEALVVVMEDLGERETLFDVLLRDSCADAVEGLVTLTRCMSRLHMSTLGREAEFVRCGGAPSWGSDFVLFEAGLRRCLAYARRERVPVPTQLVGDLDEMEAFFAQDPR